MRRRMNNSNYEIPAEVVVCRSGKHSSFRGESPIEDLVIEMMVKTRSQLRRTIVVLLLKEELLLVVLLEEARHRKLSRRLGPIELANP